MEGMKCPRCARPLEKSFCRGRVSFQCPDGHGRAVTLSAVRALCGRLDFANSLWRRAMENPSGIGGPCPVCGRPMSLVVLSVAGRELELDICCRCQEIWFDPNELEALPAPPPPTKETELPPRAKEILALHAIRQMDADMEKEPPSGWRYLAGLLGFPVESGAPLLAGYPWCTWGIAALCIAMFLLTIGNPDCISDWGLIPAECLRRHGATFITSMFLHLDIMHLVGNLYFLLIFGDNVEDALGRPLFLALLLASGLGASLLHLAVFPGSQLPCVGASGFISGVIAAYAVFFPKVSIHLCIGRGCLFRWLCVPAWGAFALWMLYQTAMGLLVFHRQEGGVAFFAHVGGALVGLMLGCALRHQVQPRLED